MSSLYKYIFLALTLQSCQTSKTLQLEIKTKIISIAYLKSQYEGYPHTINDNIGIEGVFRSNDFEGNFYKTIVLEDNTSGIDIKIGMENIFTHFMRNRKYVVQCNGLTLGSYGGTLQLGYPSDDPKYQTSDIPEDKIATHIGPASQTDYPLIPTIMEFNEFTPRYISCWIGLNTVQFIDEELGETWSDNEQNSPRHLINSHGDTMHVYTNVNASYSQHILPSGSGNIEGILGYFNKEYQLRLTSLYFVLLDNPRFLSTHRPEEYATRSLVVALATTNPLALQHDIQ